MQYLVYALIDPRTGETRYVGKSCSGLQRPREHVRDLDGPPTHKRNWLKQLKRIDLSYSISVLYASDTSEGLAQAERHWVSEMKMRGNRLTNATEGGEGTPGFRHSEETKARFSAIRRGRPGQRATAATKERMRLAHGVRPFVDQHGTEYKTQKQASRVLGVSQGNISAVLRGLRQSASGYVFVYVEASNG